MMINKPVILIVDDHIQNIQLLEGLLVRQGYEIIQAESGEEALEKLILNQVDLVLLDVMMPGMSGYEVLSKLRADNKTQRIPVVMITVHNEKEARIKALESGCDDFITKPFDQYELIVRVKSLLRIKFLNDEVDEAREFAENVINTVREPLISLDQDLRVVTANCSFYEFFKVNPEETVGQLIYDLGNKQWDIPGLRELLETILPQHTTFDNYEVEHDFTTIGRRIMLLNARQIQKEMGNGRIILLAIEDITERKQLEYLLSESEMRYRRIFETASDGIVLLEKCEGHIVHANPAAEKMLGYSKEEYVGKMLQDIGVHLDTCDFPTLMQALDMSGILNYSDVTVKTKSGHNIDTDIYMVDRARLAQCNIRDVTERKRADEKLKEEKAFIDNALNTLKDIFFVFDFEGRFLRWNQAMIVVSGYTDGEIALMMPVDLLKNDDLERVSKASLETVREGSSSMVANLVTKDGRQVPYEIKMSLLRDHTGNILGISGVGRDITERNKLEKQLLHSQKMEAIGTLAGGIAHDFNNMLAVIMGYGGMVLDGLEADNPLIIKMNQVLIAAEKAANLTKQLLVFSRKQDIEVKPLNINESIVGIQKMLSRIIRENINFTLNIAASPLIVMADSGQIEQVLMNLASNACDAMPEGGRLVIGTGVEKVDEEYVTAYGYGKPGTYAIITVSDTGIGMDMETRKKIFEPFFTTKEMGKGTGLGLAISYGIIKNHNGYIMVYSEPGSGTLFKIYLPLLEEMTVPDNAAEAETTVTGGNETILVAEDEASIRAMLKSILESSGYSVITAEDGEDALKKFMENREKIQLALLDMIMPKKSGKEVGEVIMEKSPGTKVLFSSGYLRDNVNTGELIESGFDFIHKPVKPKDLLKKIREVLDR